MAKKPSSAAQDPDAVAFISRRVREGEYFFLDLQPRSQAALAVACGGREICGPDYVMERAGFDFLALEYVAEGTGELELAGRNFPLRAGTIFTYGPGVAHRIGVGPGAHLVKYFVDFTGREAARLLKKGSQHTPQALTVGDPLRVQQIFEDLIRTGREGERHARRICALLLEMLILRMDERALPRREVDGMSWSTYQACRNHIAQHCLQLKTIGEVASACAISEAHLCRIFKRYHATTPYRYLVQLKMSHAARGLLDPRVLIKEVAARTGYDDAYLFSKVFKRTLGVSPETFRRHRLWHRRPEDETLTHLVAYTDDNRSPDN